MPIVRSKFLTKMSYSGVELALGENAVTSEVAAVLAADPSFRRHEAAGHVSIVRAPPVVRPDPRQRKKGEAEKDYKARMRELDAKEAAKASNDVPSPTADEAKFLDDFFAMSLEDRTALTLASSEREQALIVADPRNKD